MSRTCAVCNSPVELETCTCSCHPSEPKGTTTGVVPDAVGLDSFVVEGHVWCNDDD
jgi:hypothetical protein